MTLLQVIVCSLTIASVLGAPDVCAQIPSDQGQSSIASGANPSQNSQGTRAAATAPLRGESKRIDWLSSLEFSLSVSVLLFGVLVFIAELFVIKSGRYSPNDSTKLLAVTLIIVATLFIITAGFSSEQIAPAMGLFGTVAGYLLGRTQPHSNESA